MNRSVRWLGGVLACALAVAGCSSGSKGTSSPTTSTPGSVTPATAPPVPVPPPTPPTVYGIARKGGSRPIQVLGTIKGGRLAGQPAPSGTPIYTLAVTVFGPIWFRGVAPATLPDGTPFGVVPDSGTAAVLPIPVTACSLVSPDQVNALLATAATGTEDDLGETNKTCSWVTGGVSTKMSLGVIRIGNGDVGYGSGVTGLSGQTTAQLAGVGDRATYVTGRSTTTGLNIFLLIANKGSVSLSINTGYGGSSPSAAAVQDQYTTIANAVFKKLGA